MKVQNLNKIQEQPYIHPVFKGGLVKKQPVVTEEDTKAVDVTNVHFSKGARCKFHTHTVDQVLVVTSGKGIVATEREEVVVTVGDVIFFPAGEKHWHGATTDSEFSHLYLWITGGRTEVFND
jgi:quercetin dioxygenase-like cupin family protein